MSEMTMRDLAEARVNAMNSGDWDALEALIDPDYFEDYPQSGERVRGFANLRAILEGYPGGLARGTLAMSQVVAPDDRWVMTPNFTVVKVAGTADVFTTILRARYPDDTEWFVIVFNRARGGRLVSATTYFAPDFPAPEWRAHLVEQMPRDASATG